MSPTNAIRKEGDSGVWNHPEGAILLHSNARIVHYKGANLLAWKSIRVNDTLKAGDEVKVSWNIDNDQADNAGSGRVLFEVNGNAVAESIDQVRSGLVPTLHLQQKGASIKAIFAAKAKASPAFATEEADDADDTFNLAKVISNDIGAGHRRQNLQLCRQVCRMKVNKNNNQDTFPTSNYR